MKRFTESWKAIKLGQKVIIVAVVVLTFVLIGVVTSVNSQVDYAVLYTNLDQADSGAIYTYLEDQQIPMQTASNNTILVPEDQVEAIRMELNAQNLPANAASATDTSQMYLAEAMAFGATDKDKERIYQFQLQMDLQNIINMQSKVDSSVVVLNMVEDSPYVLSDDSNKVASATVAVNPRPGTEWTEADYATVQSLVSGAVRDLPVENVTVVNNATMYTYNGGDTIGGGGAGAVANQIDLETKVAMRLRDQIVNLFAPVFGPEKLTANVNVDLSFDTQTTQTITLAPVTDLGEENNEGIVVSRKNSWEAIADAAAAEGVPGMDPNGGAPIYQEVGADLTDARWYQVTEEINAEVNEINDLLEREQGYIKGISATLIIDGEEEMSDVLPEIRQQISTAVGIPSESITVSSMPFEQNTLMRQAMEEQAAALEQQQRSDLIQRIITIGAILGGIIIVVSLILSAIRKKREQELEEQRLKWMEEQETQNADAGIDVVADEEINIEELMGKEDAGPLAQLQQLVQKNPEGVAQVLRNWLTDDFRR